MKKTGLLMVMSLLVLALAGCNCNCDNNDGLNEAIQNCLDKWWTHSLIHSQTAVYWECSFPSGVTCDDDLLRSGECFYEPDVSNIDTEEKRLAGCDENIAGWIKDFEEWELVGTDWEDESEAWASFVRNGVVHYTKGGTNRKMSVECVADFVDWSISTSYEDGEPETAEVSENMNEELVTEWEEVTEIVAEETIAETVEAEE